MEAIFAERLLNVAKALRESPDPKAFTMEWYGTSCGTPCCAMGHYAARKDLQDSFELGHDRMIHWRESGKLVAMPVYRTHFGLTRQEAVKLFDANGCNNAKTPEEAAEYIERKVAQWTSEGKESSI